MIVDRYVRNDATWCRSEFFETTFDGTTLARVASDDAGRGGPHPESKVARPTWHSISIPRLYISTDIDDSRIRGRDPALSRSKEKTI